MLSLGRSFFFLSLGRLDFSYAYRPNELAVETVNATIVPGLTPSNRDIPTSTNDIHVAHAYAQEGALRKTTKQIGVTLVGKMHECTGYFFGEGYHNVNSIQDE